MLEFLFGVQRSDLPFLFNKNFESDGLRDALERRISGEPLQYIIGQWEFYGLTFEVNPHCLCPRADTEIAVEKAIKILPPNAEFLELCTGSGCIPISVCKNREDVRGVATDIFEETLAIAKRNAERNGVDDRVRFVNSSVFDFDYWTQGEGRALVGDGFDAIISNPPYIPTEDIEDLSKEVKREPRAALDGGDDGLDFYREIVGKYRALLKENGVMIFEIGYDQAEALKAISAEAGCACEIFKDFCENDRVAVVRQDLKRS